ncbi:hypothetical protein [Kiloniella sp. b19]|uniref:hypothetical protein n=1 Tax=Kiloniella sp. GXU_MW_B19 TaxID=3141326 RepID=UPI0031DAFE96
MSRSLQSLLLALALMTVPVTGLATPGVIFVYSTDGKLAERCEGTVVSRKHVLTAASCFLRLHQDKQIGMMEFHADYKGTSLQDERGFVAASGHVSLDYLNELKGQGRAEQMFPSDLALIEFLEPQTFEWVGDKYPAQPVVDRFSSADFSDHADAEISFTTHGGALVRHAPLERSCQAEYTRPAFSGVYWTDCEKSFYRRGTAVHETGNNGQSSHFVGLLSPARSQDRDIYLVKTFGKYISAINAVLSGQKHESFQTVSLAPQDPLVTAIAIQNNCQSSDHIRISIAAYDALGKKWVLETQDNIFLGERANFTVRTNISHYYYNLTHRGESMLIGEADTHYKINGKSEPFQKMDMGNDAASRLHTLKVSCQS